MYCLFPLCVDDLSKATLKSLWESEEGFDDEPFVRAAALFRDETFTDIIQLLTDAVESGNNT